MKIFNYELQDVDYIYLGIILFFVILKISDLFV